MGGVPQRKGEQGSNFTPELTLFRQMADMSNDGFFLTNGEGRFLYINARGCELSGYTEAELKQMSVPDLALNFPPNRFRDLVEQLAHGRVPPLESLNRRRDGSIYLMEISVSRMDIDGQTYLFGIARDATERKRMQALLENFSQNVLTTLEAERRRIARELHDDLGQALALVGLQVHSLRRARTDLPGDVSAALSEIDGAIRQTIEAVARLARNYHPAELADLGISHAIGSFAKEFAARHNLRLKLSTTRLEGVLSDDRALHLYRIVQEALNNVAKHAGATLVEVELDKRGAEIIATVRDDGRGFAVSEKQGNKSGLGLTTMRERAHILGGTLEIRARNSGGTEIQVAVPTTQ